MKPALSPLRGKLRNQSLTMKTKLTRTKILSKRKILSLQKSISSWLTKLWKKTSLRLPDVRLLINMFILYMIVASQNSAWRGSSVASRQPIKTHNEFLVKFSDQSYLHVKWMKE
jgi:hypothetical protein